MGMNDMIRYLRQMSGRLGSNIYAGVQPQANAQHYSFLRQLQKEMKEKNSLDLPWNELQLVVFDLETTGFYPEKGDVILSIGAIKMQGSTIMEEDSYYSLVKSSKQIPPDISELTNITNTDLEDAPELSDVLLSFFKFIGCSTLFAHHAKHEQAFMKKATLEELKSRFEHRVIDTSFLIRVCQPQLTSLPLEVLCQEIGIEVHNRHHALEDARMTAKLLQHYIKEAEKIGFRNLREVYERLSTIL